MSFRRDGCLRKIKKILFFYLFFSTSIFAEEWNVDADGTWNTATNWNPQTVPDGSSDTAIFGSVITAPRTVTVDGTFSVGTLNVDNANVYTLSGGTLNIDGEINFTNSNGNAAHEIASNLALTGISQTVTQDTTENVTLSGTISGSSSLLSFDGTGQTTMSGTNTYTTDTSVSSGILTVNGSAASSSFTVSGGTLNGSGTTGLIQISGGTLSGTGTNLGIILNSGTISPGDSIGTINITGNYAQSSGAIYEVEIKGTDSDKIIATGLGNISLGAVLNVSALQGSFIKNTTYDILTAALDISQLWSVTNFPDGFSFSLQLVNGDTIARLTLLSSSALFFGRIVDPGNPSAVDGYLSCLDITIGSDLANVIGATDSLNSTELNLALNQLHPALFGAFELTNFDNNALIAYILAQHLIALPCNRRQCFTKWPTGRKNNLWISPFGSFSDIGEYQQLREFDSKSGGFVTGYDRCLPSNLIVGASTGYAYTHLDWKDFAGDADIHKVFAALYSGYSIRYFSIDASLMGGGNFYHVTRKIQFSTIDRKAGNDHTGYFMTPHLGLATHVYYKGVVADFFGSLDYFYFYQPAYSESGAGSLNLNVDKKISQMLRPELGAKLALDFALGNDCIRPFVALRLLTKIPLSQDKYESKFRDFAGQSCNLKVNTFDKSKNFISPEVGVIYTMNDFTFSAIYKGEFAKHYHVNQMNGKVDWLF